MRSSTLSVPSAAVLLVGLILSAVATAQGLGAVASGRSGADVGINVPADFDLEQAAAVLTDPLSSALSARQLETLQRPDRRAKRGGPASTAAQLYRQLSPAVVLVAAKGSLGSGSLVDDRGHVLTNWHVIRGFSEVGVVFKPAEEGTRITAVDVVRARVVRVDEVADLALLKVDSVPAGIQRMPMGSPQDVQVGADVHAIGHPAGEHWTYTRGVISQRRPGYEWADNTGKQHVANVVQTQTPINPGNSGGPLISDEGRMIGVNTFKRNGNENLNFAILIDEVLRFMSSSTDRYAANAPAAAASAIAAECKGGRETARGRSTDGLYDFVGYDLNCRGGANLELRVPVDTTQPMTAVYDRNADGKTDLIVFCPKRDGKWLYSYHDNDFDGQWDLVGHHPEGKIVASRFESYAVWLAARTARSTEQRP